MSEINHEKSPLEEEVSTANSPKEQHEKRLARYSAAKARQESVLDYIFTTLDQSGKGLLSREAEALEDCGSFLIFRHYLTLDLYKMIAGCTCKKHLLCALCATRRAAKYIAVYSEKIKNLIFSSGKEYDTVMITFTVKNGENVEERFSHLLDSMKRLLHKRRNSLAKNPKTDTVLKHVDSAVYSYEITYKEETGYHPHCHMIAMIPKGVFSFEKSKIKGQTCSVPWEMHRGLLKDWQAITKDSFIIDVRRIVESEQVANPGAVQVEVPTTVEPDSLLKALVEVFKYALKMNDLDVEKQVEVYNALKGRRLIGSFGSLRGMRVSENLNDKPLQDEELPFIDLLYQYSGVTCGYQEIMRGVFDIEASPRGILDLKNRISHNQRTGETGHFSAGVDRKNEIEEGYKKWSMNPENKKVSETVIPF